MKMNWVPYTGVRWESYFKYQRNVVKKMRTLMQLIDSNDFQAVFRDCLDEATRTDLALIDVIDKRIAVERLKNQPWEKIQNGTN